MWSYSDGYTIFHGGYATFSAGYVVFCSGPAIVLENVYHVMRRIFFCSKKAKNYLAIAKKLCVRHKNCGSLEKLHVRSNSVIVMTLKHNLNSNLNRGSRHICSEVFDSNIFHNFDNFRYNVHNTTHSFKISSYTTIWSYSSCCTHNTNIMVLVIVLFCGQL